MAIVHECARYSDPCALTCEDSVVLSCLPVSPKLTSVNQVDVPSSDDRVCCCYGLPLYLMERMVAGCDPSQSASQQVSEKVLFLCRGMSLLQFTRNMQGAL